MTDLIRHKFRTSSTEDGVINWPHGPEDLFGHWFICMASVHQACWRAEAWHAWHASVSYKIQIMSKFQSLQTLFTYEPTIMATI